MKVVQDQGTPYGPLFTGVSLAPVAETLSGQAGLEAVAVSAIEPAAKAMTDGHPVAIQSLVLSAYQNAPGEGREGRRGEGDRRAGREAGGEDRRRVPQVGPAVQADAVRRA